MAAVGAAAGAVLPPAEGGTRGPAPRTAGGAASSSDRQAPRSWLQHRQGTVLLPWGTWLAGGSMPCAAPASPESAGAQPGAGSQSPGPARCCPQRPRQGGAGLRSPGCSWAGAPGWQHAGTGAQPGDEGHALSSASPGMWVALAPQPGFSSPPVTPGGAHGCWGLPRAANRVGTPVISAPTWSMLGAWGWGQHELTVGTAAPSTAGRATWLRLSWHGCCQPSCRWGRGRARGTRSPAAAAASSPAPALGSACTHGRAGSCQTHHSPAARRERGQRGTSWQRQAHRPGRAVHHGRRTQPVPPSTTHRGDGSAAFGASTRPCTAPGECWSPALCHSPARRAGQLVPGTRARPSERAALGQQQSTLAITLLLCCHGSAREQPSILWQSWMFSAQAAQRLAEVPAVSPPRLSRLPLGDCGVPKASLTFQSSTEEGTYWLCLDLRVPRDDGRASRRADGNTSLLPLPNISKVSASCSLL